jgi:branched-chain amino acid transport system permease protein
MFKESRLACLITLGLLATVFLVAPNLYSNESLLFTMMTFIALAQGLNLLYGFTGYLPFGYVGFFGAGAYGTALLVLHAHFAAVPAVIGGGLAAVAAALVLSPLLRLSGAYFAIANLAASQILYLIVANPALSDITGGPYGVNIQSVFNPDDSYLATLAIMLVACALTIYFRTSRFGLALRAMTQNYVSAQMAGINIVRARLIVWLASATIAGLAGGSYAWNISVYYPQAVFGLQISVFAIVFALFGGVGTVIGPILGAAILYALYNAIGISVPQYFELIYGFLIVLLVLFLPDGVLSLLPRRSIHGK